MPHSIRVIISGRVQSVGYRAWTVTAASDFDLRGWVRNRSDGTMEAVFSGDEEKITSMVEACKEGHAGGACVSRIESFTWSETVDDGPFRAKPTV